MQAAETKSKHKMKGSGSISRCAIVRWLLLQLMMMMMMTACCVASSSASAILPKNNHARRVLANSQIAYDVPPFALQFRSQNILHGSDDKMDGVLLASTLGEPLKLIVTEFLTAVFQEELAHTSTTTTADNSAVVPDIVWQFLGFELQVRVHYKQLNEGTGRLRKLLQSSSNSDMMLLDFYAEFTGTAKYLAPVDSSKEPSADTMYELLGKWMKTGFTDDLDVLRQMLIDSEAEMLQSHQMLSVETNVVTGVNPFETTSSRGNGGSKTFLSILLVSGIILTVVIGLFTVQRDRMKTKRESVMESSFPQPHPEGELEMNETLPGRYGDALEVIQASEEYLAKHRPDLYSESIVTKNTSPLSGSSEGSNGRQYEEGKETTDLSPTTIVTTTKGYAPVGTWFKKITASIGSSVHHSSPSPPANGDGLYCDEDVAKYAFPFKDFPRHDGTPCLIYSDENNNNSSSSSSNDNNNAQNRHNDPLTYNNNNNNTPEPTKNNTSTPLSDDEFKKQLSLQSVNSTFEIDDGMYEDDHQEGVDQIRDTEFTEKLERMVTMRLRHYEKDSIMMRAREARKKEQQHAEARERQLRLRRHEMEIDLEEIEADLRPPALSRKKSTETAPPKKTHRVVSSDSNFFSSCSNNLMELEAGSNKADDLAHAERLVQAIGNGAKKPPAKVSPSTSPIGFASPSPTAPHTPLRHHQETIHLQRSPYRSPTKQFNRIPRSPDVRRHMIESGSVAQPVRKSRSETSGDGEKHANSTSIRGRSPRRNRSRSRSAHRRSHSHGSHRRSHSHGSNEFFENSSEETHDDVITHGIAAYTNFV